MHARDNVRQTPELPYVTGHGNARSHFESSQLEGAYVGGLLSSAWASGWGMWMIPSGENSMSKGTETGKNTWLFAVAGTEVMVKDGE